MQPGSVTDWQGRHIPQGPYSLAEHQLALREDNRDRNIPLAYFTGGPEPQGDGEGKYWRV